MNLKNFDKQYYQKYNGLVGLDEAGRGPLAGPVVSACVWNKNKKNTIDKINDSKKLTEKIRLQLFPIILENFFIGIGIIDNKTIDKINILNASHLAMKKAFYNLQNKHPQLTINFALIDGYPIKANFPHKGIIKGDSKSYLIAAASIVAKVTRDQLMIKYAKQYPQYKFEKHKGYGTKEHLQYLKSFGICPIHRQSFKPIKSQIREP